jgi:hypothetical protein
MKFEDGQTYRLKDKEEWFDLRMIGVGTKACYAVIENTNVDSSRTIGMEVAFIIAELNENFQITKLNPMETADIIYTPELINLYIDMALQTNDKVWFNELMSKKGVVA